MGGPYSVTGGARIGDGFFPLNVSFPFAKLECDPSGVTLHIDLFIWRRAYLFPSECVEVFDDYGGLLSQGLRLRHHAPGQPEFVVFWTGEREAAKVALRGLGYRCGARDR